MGWFAFSHHPLCRRYEDHVFRIRFKQNTLYLCQGCSLTALGWIFGIIITVTAFLPLVNYQWYHLLIILSSIFSSIVIVELANISNRCIKRTIRFMGGLGLGLFTVIALDFKSVGLFILSIAILISSYIGFVIIRSFKHKNKDLCERCEELQNEGTICSGLKQKVAAEKKYSKFASDLLQEELKVIYMQKYRHQE